MIEAQYRFRASLFVGATTVGSPWQHSTTGSERVIRYLPLMDAVLDDEMEPAATHRFGYRITGRI
jgi:hypothetical protein